MSSQASAARRSGWLTFAAIIMFAVGFARIVSGINLLSGGDQVADLTHSLYGDQLTVWGVWDLVVALLALTAAFSLLAGHGYGRAVTYVWGVVVIMQGTLMLQAAPAWGLASIALAGLVVYGVAKVSDEEGW